jgi:ubiquinone/menaquinone biosynthesis C-methylase UbiE
VPLTGINSMQIIQIRRKSKSFDRPLDVFLDVGGGIGDLAVAAVHAVEAAF